MTLAALAVGIGVGDIVVGRILIEKSVYRGRPLPPFGLDFEGRHKAWLEARVASLAAGTLPGVRGGFDPELGWTNRPGRTERSETENSEGSGLSYEFNAFGARGRREYAESAPEGTVRVACFGASFVYGSEVPDGSDWPALLESRDPKLEVLNFGVGGYGIDQALLRFRHTVHEIDARVVFIGVQLDCIGRNVNRLRPLYYPPETTITVKPRFVLESGVLHLVPLPFPTWRALIETAVRGELEDALAEHEYWRGDEPAVPGSTIARLLAAHPAYVRREPWRLWVDVESEPFRVTTALIDAFYREALAAGAEHALILVFPGREDIVAMRRRGARFWQYLLDFLDGREIPYLDFGPVLSATEDLDEIFLEVHLNRAGNDIVAQALRTWLDARY